MGMVSLVYTYYFVTFNVQFCINSCYIICYILFDPCVKHMQFHDNFHVKNCMNREASPCFGLASALESQEGSPEEVDLFLLWLC